MKKPYICRTNYYAILNYHGKTTPETRVGRIHCAYSSTSEVSTSQVSITEKYNVNIFNAWFHLKMF